MDSWSGDQIERMKRGGNQQCKDFLREHGMVDLDNKSIRERYDSPAAQLYKGVLDARIAGRPEPTELPSNTNSSNNGSSSIANRKMEGFGSSSPPSSSLGGRKSKLGAYVVVATAVLAWYCLSSRP